MKISVEVEKAYGFPSFYIIIGIILFAAAVALLIYIIYRIRHRDKYETEKKPKEIKLSEKEKLRRKYLDELYSLDVKFSQGSIDERTLNEQLSKICRDFVHKISGQDTNKMTLSELRHASGLIGLSRAIALFYQPEFAPKARASAKYNINAAREVISKWI